MYYTTLSRIQEYGLHFNADWQALLSHPQARQRLMIRRCHSRPFWSLGGISTAIRALGTVDDPACERDARLFAARCARQVQHLLQSEHAMKVALEALDVAEWALASAYPRMMNLERSATPPTKSGKIGMKPIQPSIPRARLLVRHPAPSPEKEPMTLLAQPPAQPLMRRAEL